MSVHRRPPDVTRLILLLLGPLAWVSLFDVITHQQFSLRATGAVEPYRPSGFVALLVLLALSLAFGGRR